MSELKAIIKHRVRDLAKRGGKCILKTNQRSWIEIVKYKNCVEVAYLQ